MRAMHATGRVTQSGLAKHFKVHPMTVNSIINNRSWMTEEES